MTRRPADPPIGVQLTRAARTATAAFERSMAEAGSSVSTWQVLVLVRSQEWSTQSRLAEAMGVTPATLTHHLNAMEKQGLVRRWREPGNRRSQLVELTGAGQELFEKLRGVALRHDRRLRSELSPEETAMLASLLDKLVAGLGEDPA